MECLSTSWRASMYPKVFSSLLESPLVQSLIGICKNSWHQFTGNKAERHWAPAWGGGSYESPRAWTMPGSTDRWVSFLGPWSSCLQNREYHTHLTWDHVCEEFSSEPASMYGRNWFCCWQCYSCYYKRDILKWIFLHWVLFWFPTTSTFIPLWCHMRLSSLHSFIVSLILLIFIECLPSGWGCMKKKGRSLSSKKSQKETWIFNKWAYTAHTQKPPRTPPL